MTFLVNPMDISEDLLKDKEDTIQCGKYSCSTLNDCFPYCYRNIDCPAVNGHWTSGEDLPKD